MAGKRQDWIVGIGGSEIDYVDLILYKDFTVDEIKQELVELIKESRISDCRNRHGCDHDFETCNEECWAYDFGTETVEEVEERKIWNNSEEIELYAYANFNEYHEDYVAVPLCAIRTVERE